MSAVATYVFIDLETTGMPQEETNKTKITEISMVAVKRDHVLDTRPGAAPRVQHKLTLCLNPRKLVYPECTKVTGLCNDLLEHEPHFNMQVFNMISTFLGVLSKPVCLIAQNGTCFDFPILKRHVEKLNVAFSDDLLCADCYHAFYDILEARKSMSTCSKVDVSKESGNTNRENEKSEIDINELYVLENTLHMKSKNETTPRHVARNGDVTSRKSDSKISKARRRFPWSQGLKPKVSYKLKDIYERVLNRPALEAHRAENDCILALECSVALGREFVKWVDVNYFPFNDVKPMTIGVPLGL